MHKFILKGVVDISNKTKIDSVVFSETRSVAVWALIFSVIMQSVFLIIGKWDYTVLLGNILGYASVMLNFFLMAFSVQKALEKDEKDAKQTMTLSHSLRMLMLFLIALAGVLLPFFNTLAVIIPFIFPGIAVKIRSLLGNKTNK